MLTALEKKHCDTEAKALIDNASAGCRNEENRIEMLTRIRTHASVKLQALIDGGKI